MEMLYLDETDIRDDCPKCKKVGFLMDKIEVTK